MIYSGAVFLIVIAASEAYFPQSLRRTRSQLRMTGTADDLITVRFINTVGGKEIIAQVEPGSNLLMVGDKVGVKLPRACRTGLCGSCTCEMMDPMAVKTATNPRDGFATIRACSVKCFVPEGMSEMVVDVYRMSGKGRQPVMPSSTSTVEEVEEEAPATNPMARFSGNWEKEFRPNWELETDYSNQVGGASNPREAKVCNKCKGMKRLECYCCNGKGRVMMGDGVEFQCSICVGSRSVGCGYCRGTGLLLAKKKN